LREVARRRGMSYDDVIKQRGIIKHRNRKPSKIPFGIKVNVVEDYIFSSKSLRDFDIEGDVSIISYWYHNEDILRELARRRGLSVEQISTVRDEKISRNRTPTKDKSDVSVFQEFLETHEELQQVIDLLGAYAELGPYLTPEEQEASLQATAQRVHENLNGQKKSFSSQKLVYMIPILNVGVVQRASPGTTPLPELLTRGYEAGLVGTETASRILGQWVYETLEIDQTRTPKEGQKVVEDLQRELAGV
jgi:hypothetical protein